jgi:hypothetical protein
MFKLHGGSNRSSSKNILIKPNPTERLEELPAWQMIRVAKALEKKHDKRMLLLTNNINIIESELKNPKGNSLFANNPSNEIIARMKYLI